LREVELMEEARRYRSHSPSEPAIDRVMALSLALAFPVSMLFWLLGAVGPAPWYASGVDARQSGSMDLVWVPAPARRPERVRPEPVLEPTLGPVPEPSQQTGAPGASQESSAAFPQAVSSIEPDTVSVPADPSGTVYDPSRVSQIAAPATRLLRADAALSNEAARIDEVSLQLHPAPGAALAMADRCTAIVEVSIDAHGDVTDARLVGPCANRATDTAALEAVRLWSFHPEIREGAAVPSVLQVEVDVPLQ
jgi:protein TonB